MFGTNLIYIFIFDLDNEFTKIIYLKTVKRLNKTHFKIKCSNFEQT
jgi:hypothetical protein